METSKRKSFNTRAFTVLAAALAGLGLPITGVANHIYQMDAMTIQRHAWMSAHNALGILFVVFSIWHVLLHRRAFWIYVRSATGRIPVVSREVILAGTIVAIILLLFVGHAFHAGR